MVHDLTLNTGAKMPAVGLGVWLGSPGRGENKETYDMVAAALKAGYRHVDTAFAYGNENAIGQAIRDSGVPREHIFVTTKLAPFARVRRINHLNGLAVNQTSYIPPPTMCSLARMQLMHWPQAQAKGSKAYVPYGQFPTFSDTWKWMEKLLGNKVKAIGVSNFSTKNLKILLETATIIPAVNQVESSPYLPQTALTEFCKEKAIALTAYSPLGQPRAGTRTSPILEDTTIKAIAEKLGKPVGSVILSWEVQRPGWSVVPKSSNPARLKSNLEIFKLDQDDFDAISVLHKEPGKLMSLCDFGPSNQGWQEKGVISGWTLQDIGWDQPLIEG